MWNVEKFYDKAYSWVLTYGPRIIIAIIVLVVGEWIIRLLNKWLRKILSTKEFDPSLESFFQSLFSILLQVLLFLLLMQIMGMQMTLFASVIAAFGVAAGLALSGTLQNFASGVLIMILKPYRVGDNIVTQGQTGKVSAIQLFYTYVITFDNRTVVVPNSKLSNEIILNLSREDRRRLDIEIKFPYSVDFDAIKNIVTNTIGAAKNFLKEPQARIGISVMELDGYKVSVEVWTNAHGFEDTRLALQEKILKDIKEAGIKLPGMP
ncbi:MAG: mechanosensitive ion channel family protein [Chitinophagaceae bacterium]